MMKMGSPKMQSQGAPTKGGVVVVSDVSTIGQEDYILCRADSSGERIGCSGTDPKSKVKVKSQANQ